MGRYIEDPQGMLEALGFAIAALGMGIGFAVVGLGEATGFLTDEGKDEAIKMIENILGKRPDDNAALIK